jgi:hypothetical protein
VHNAAYFEHPDRVFRVVTGKLTAAGLRPLTATLASGRPMGVGRWTAFADWLADEMRMDGVPVDSRVATDDGAVVWIDCGRERQGR